MDLASRTLADGADFNLMGLRTMLKSSRPVAAVCAIRTVAGKSQTTRYVVKRLKAAGLRTVVIRHPMPYGNIADEAVQRFSSQSDLDSRVHWLSSRQDASRQPPRARGRGSFNAAGYCRS